MRKALYILGHLDDADMRWLAQAGTRQKLQRGDVIVREGVAIDALFVILEGAIAVTLANGEHLARLGAGEIIGEIAFVDSAPPTATVAAAADAVVLEVKKTRLQAKIDADVGFAARFYRAVAVFLADRLRRTTRRLGYEKAGDLERPDALDDELDVDLLDRVSEAGERFTRLVVTIESRYQEGRPSAP